MPCKMKNAKRKMKNHMENGQCAMDNDFTNSPPGPLSLGKRGGEVFYVKFFCFHRVYFLKNRIKRYRHVIYNPPPLFL